MDIDKIYTDPNEPKKFIYFPSLSAGGMASSLKKNLILDSGIPARFYSPDYPAAHRHPFYLVTAGHHYKKMTYRQDFGLHDAFVFGDSGGFQIASGAMKYDPSIRHQIFSFLEENSDVAANLDVPAKLTYAGRFKEAYDFSIENFKYFEKHQTGKTKFLNVLQGSNPDEYDFWYANTKHFNFNGWCIGGAAKLIDLMYTIALFIHHGEFDKDHVKLVHVLGLTKVTDLFVLSRLQHNLNRFKGNKIFLSTDSSSIGQYPVYGNLMHWVDIKTLRYIIYSVTRGHTYVQPGTVIPHACPPNPITDMLTFDVVNKHDRDYYNKSTLYNLTVFNYIREYIDRICYTDDLGIFDGLVDKSMMIILRSIDEMFHHPEHALQIFAKHRDLYITIDGDNGQVTKNETLNEFFNF